MSASLGRLREHFGDQLLIRVGREMATTPLAESLVVPVREALLSVNRALTTQPSFDPASADRQFRIALSDYASFVMLPQLLQRLTALAPGIIIKVEPFNPAILSSISHGDLACAVTVKDISLLGGPKVDDTLNIEPLFSDDFVCVADANHPALAEGVTLELYEKLSHNLAQFGQPSETLVEEAWRHRQIKPHVGVIAPGFVALLFMLPGTPLLGTVQRRLAEALAPKLGLRIHECPLKIPYLDEVLVWHERDRFDPAHAFLRQQCQDVTRGFPMRPAKFDQ